MLQIYELFVETYSPQGLAANVVGRMPSPTGRVRSRIYFLTVE